MTDYQPNAEAIEKAAIVLCATDRQESVWAILDESERNAFRTDAEAALSAAYPALRAQIIHELAEEAEAEAESNRDAKHWPRMFDGQPFPDISIEARAARWLRARTDQTQETR